MRIEHTLCMLILVGVFWISWRLSSAFHRPGLDILFFCVFYSQTVLWILVDELVNIRPKLSVDSTGNRGQRINLLPPLFFYNTSLLRMKMEMFAFKRWKNQVITTCGRQYHNIKTVLFLCYWWNLLTDHWTRLLLYEASVTLGMPVSVLDMFQM